MADISISRISRDGDVITAYGTGFTKTTTKFYDQDSEPLTFEVISDTEATLTLNEDTTAVFAVKGEVSTEAAEIEDAANTTPGDTSEDDETADVAPGDLDKAANAGAAVKNVEPLPEGEHLPGPDFRQAVENTAAGDLDMDPREPYPTGNPPDPRETYHRIHGYYPDDEGEQAAQLDADPKT